MLKEVKIDGITLHLSQPHTNDSQWIGQTEVLEQLLACWLVVNDRDLPLSPRLVGSPGIGKTALALGRDEADITEIITGNAAIADDLTEQIHPMAQIRLDA